MNSDPDWGLYRTFLAVIEEGSLSAAARRLALTQPTIARHIDMLEAAVGADLFLRTQRGLIPTDMALCIRPHAEMLSATAAALMRKASGSAGEVAGAVRISASEVIGVELLPPILTRLKREHPKLVVELVASNAVDDLLQRSADIAVRNVEPTQDSLVARKLRSIELGLHARRDYLEARGTPETIADLANHDLVGFDRETPALRKIVERFPAFRREVYAFRAESDLAQLAAIRAGFGIGVCQTPRAGSAHELVRVLPGAVSFTMGIWIVMHEDLKTNLKYRVVFDGLAEGLANL